MEMVEEWAIHIYMLKFAFNLYASYVLEAELILTHASLLLCFYTRLECKYPWCIWNVCILLKYILSFVLFKVTNMLKINVESHHIYCIFCSLIPLPNTKVFINILSTIILKIINIHNIQSYMIRRQIYKYTKLILSQTF